MTEQEAALYLHLNVRTLQRYRAKGKLSYREVKGKTRPVIEYDKLDLDRLRVELEGQRTAGKKPKPAPKPPNPRVSFALTPEGQAELEREAQRYGMSTGEYARRLAREGLESRFASEAAELRNRVKLLETELAKTRKEFAAGFEVLLEYGGLDPAEAKRWVTENLR